MQQPQKLTRFWRFLECLHDQTAVHEEWRLALDQEFEQVSHWLRPTGGLGTEFPVSDPLVDRGYQPPCRIVELQTGELRAVPQIGMPFPVTPEKLSVYEFYGADFVKQLLANFPFQDQQQRFHGLPFLTQLGVLVPTLGFEFLVEMLMPRSTAECRRGLDAIAANEQRPFLVFTPTRRFVDDYCRRSLERNRGLLLPCCEAVVSGMHVPQLTSAADRIVREFLKQHLPDEDRPVELFFPTPTGSDWTDLRIRFMDGETVSVRIGNITRMLNYTQIGMVSAKNAQPTRQWELLRTFAAGYGILDWSSRSAHRKLQKQKNLLAQTLRKFFRIEGDPIESLNNGWRTRFAIDPDG